MEVTCSCGMRWDAFPPDVDLDAGDQEIPQWVFYALQDYDHGRWPVREGAQLFEHDLCACREEYLENLVPAAFDYEAWNKEPCES